MSTQLQLDDDLLRKPSPDDPRLSPDEIEQIMHQTLPAVLLEGGSGETSYVTRFVMLFEDCFRFLPDKGVWAAFDGKKWIFERKNRNIAIRGLTVLKTLLETHIKPAVTALNDKMRVAEPEDALALNRLIKSLVALPAKLDSIAFRKKIMDHLESDSRMVLSSDQFDQHPFLLNCQNGTYNLRTATLQPHLGSQLLRQMAFADLVPNATSAVLDKLLSDIGRGVPGLVDFLQKVMGMALIGQQIEKKFIIIEGEKNTGKSTFMKAITSVLDSFAHTAEYTILKAKKEGSGHNEPIASLAGRRVVMLNESDRALKIDSATVKGLTGGDERTASRKNEHQFTFEQIFTPILWTNFAPGFDALDAALFIRLIFIRLEYEIPEEEIDLELRERKIFEPDFKNALLWWMAEGTRKYLEDGRLILPPFVIALNEEYRKQSNPYREWFEDLFVVDAKETSWTMRWEEIDCTLRDYARDKERSIPKPSVVVDVLRSFGVIKRYSTRDGNTWIGIRLKTDADLYKNAQIHSNKDLMDLL